MLTDGERAKGGAAPERESVMQSRFPHRTHRAADVSGCVGDTHLGPTF